MTDQQIDISVSNSWKHIGDKVFDLVASTPRRHAMTEKIRSDYVEAWKWSDVQEQLIERDL
jgi:hypothetical protein